MAQEVEIGYVSHYFGKIHVAAIELTEGALDVGETIHIRGHTSDFVQKVTSMQIENADVTHADIGQSVGISVGEHARVGDHVLKVTN
jgi:translation initiation factor IF-2